MNCYAIHPFYKSTGDRLQNRMLSLQMGEHRLLFFSHINFDLQRLKGAIKVLCIVILQMTYPLTRCNWTYGIGKNDQGWLSSFQILVSFKWPSIDLSILPCCAASVTNVSLLCSSIPPAKSEALLTNFKMTCGSLLHILPDPLLFKYICQHVPARYQQEPHPLLLSLLEIKTKIFRPSSSRVEQS